MPQQQPRQWHASRGDVMSRTHLKQDARTLSRSLARSLPLSLSLSRSLSPRSLARSLGVCVHARMRPHATHASRVELLVDAHGEPHVELDDVRLL